jgi:putative solute:sodium symporter small subunit
MTPERQRAYWRLNLLVIGALLAVWLAVSFGAAIAFADGLDRVSFAGVPLGFWLGQQGAVLVFVALVLVYLVLMNALDRAFGVYED